MNDAKIRQLFELALEKPSGEREAFVNRMCGDDPALQERVRSMLRAHEEVGEFLARPTASPADESANVDAVVETAEAEGDTIGHYKLLQRIGEGGMGTVWMAAQFEPVRRKVALKIIKLGMDSRQVVARFEAERQALALMDHPNIAKVLDGGMTATGRPYFVMELVKGVPITEFCDEAKLDLRARMALFIDVCHAVQHAHQKGIIHRDIKPSNVMVTLHDGRPVPKVIDFGIAKATDQELTQKTLFTEYQQILGTPEYMAPEQAAMSGLDVDTRADVYALGALLYELLTGTKPFDLTTLLTQGYEEILRTIREVDPPRPSTRASTAGEDTGRISLARQLGAGELGRALRGDLDWIVGKAMEKDRTRRYGSANGLADDVGRYLADEPVEATPPSARYRLGKFVRRNRRAVIAGALVALLVVGGGAGTVAGLVRALDEQDRAERAEAEAKREQARAESAEADARRDLQRAEEAEADARRQLERATEVKRVVTDMLTGITPEEAGGLDTTLLRSVIDRTAQRIERGEVEDERIAADLHATLGIAYRTTGDLEKAERHQRRTVELRSLGLGPDDAATVWARAQLGLVLAMRGDLEAGAAAIEAEREAMDRVAGPDDPRSILAASNLASVYLQLRRNREAEELARASLERARRVMGASDLSTLGIADTLAGALRNLGRTEEALALQREIEARARSEHGADSIATIGAMSNIALLLQQQHRYEEALALTRTLVASARRTYGPTHWSSIDADVRQFQLFVMLRRHADAERERTRIAALVDEHLPRTHAVTLRFRRALATLYVYQRRSEEAAAILNATAKDVRADLGDDSVRTLLYLTRAGGTLVTGQRHADARALLSHVVERADRVFGPDHAFTHEAMLRLADAEAGLGRPKDGEPRIREVRRRRAERYGERDPRVLDADSVLAGNLAAQGRFDDAIELLRGLLERMPEPTADKGHAFRKLAELLESRQRYEEAEPARRGQLDAFEKTYGPTHAFSLDTRMRIAKLRMHRGHADEGAALAKAIIADARAALGDGERTICAFLGEHAMILGVARRFDEAQAVLDEAVALARERFPATDPVLAHLATLQRALDADRAAFGKDR